MVNEIKIGKIHDFNGETGYIITDEHNYPFSKKDIDSNVDNGDIVMFIPNLVIFGEEKTYVAKFIKKYDLENDKIKKKINELNDKIER